FPVLRSSNTRTGPSAARSRTSAEPMKPAPPTTSGTAAPFPSGELIVSQDTENPGRIAGDDRARRHVLRHNCPSPDERSLANRHPGEDHRPRADARPPSHTRRDHGPVGVRLQGAVGAAGPGQPVVGEAHVVADEDLVLDRDTFADERVARDLTALSNDGVRLNLDEGPDACAIANGAAIEVDEAEDLDVMTELYVGGDAVERFHHLEKRWNPSAPQRCLGRFQSGHNAHGMFAARDWIRPLDAVGEVLDYVGERLRRVEPRRDDVTRTVRDEDLPDPLGIRRHVHAAVVDLDALGMIKIVVDDAPPRAADHEVPDLDGGEPVDVD